jgi:hypothetical protein
MGKQCRSRSAGTSMPSDQDLHCFLGGFSDQEATSLDPDEMAQMCKLIWICTGCTCNKTYMYTVKSYIQPKQLAAEVAYKTVNYPKLFTRLTPDRCWNLLFAVIPVYDVHCLKHNSLIFNNTTHV